MGSHFSQCFATGQTIAPGDKCFALAIRQQATYSPVVLSYKGKKVEQMGVSHCAIYPDAYWTTVSNFIEGRYRENGDIDITENDENFRRLLVFVRVMMKQAAVTEEGENTTHDLPFDFPAFVKENCPNLQQCLDSRSAFTLSDEDKSKVFAEMASTWQHTDDVAFKNRVFIANHSGRLYPLQFTLLHGKTFDTMLSKVSDEYSPVALANKIIASFDETKATKEYPEKYFKDPELRDMISWVGPHLIERVVRQMGEFDSIEYHEKKLGFTEFGLRYLEGKLSATNLRKLLVPILKDRLVMRMLESYEVKIAPKSIRYEDTKNHIGKAYAGMVNEVSEAVSKQRKRAPRYY